MKPLKKTGKLALNKEALRSLTAENLDGINGGGSISWRCAGSWNCSTQTLGKCFDCATSKGLACKGTYTCPADGGGY